MHKLLESLLDTLFYGGLMLIWILLIAHALPVYSHVVAIARSAATLLTS
jgi:hypothetical protein